MNPKTILTTRAAALKFIARHGDGIFKLDVEDTFVATACEDGIDGKGYPVEELESAWAWAWNCIFNMGSVDLEDVDLDSEDVDAIMERKVREFDEARREILARDDAGC